MQIWSVWGEYCLLKVSMQCYSHYCRWIFTEPLCFHIPSHRISEAAARKSETDNLPFKMWLWKKLSLSPKTQLVQSIHRCCCYEVVKLIQFPSSILKAAMALRLSCPRNLHSAVNRYRFWSIQSLLFLYTIKYMSSPPPPKENSASRPITDHLLLLGIPIYTVGWGRVDRQCVQYTNT